MGHPTEASLGNRVDRVFPHPIPRNDAQDFHDRTFELATAQAVLSQTTRKPLLVRGERCIGKTSLLNRIRGWLESGPQRELFRAIAIEPGSLTSWQEFGQEIWDGIEGCVEAAGFELPDRLAGPRELRTFSHFLGELRRLLAYLPGVVFVIFLDELDKIQRHADALQQTKILSLIRFLVESEDLPVAFVISVLQDIPGQAGLGSPLAVEEVRLQPFSLQDTWLMAEALLGPHQALAPDAQGWLARQTGGHPYFLKLLLAMTCDAHGAPAIGSTPAVLTAKDLECAMRGASPARRRQLNDVLQNVYREYLNDSEREILWWLATAQGGRVTGAELRTALGRLRTAVEELIDRSYVDRAPDGGCELRIGWLRDWLRSWPESQSELDRLRGPGPSAQIEPQSGVVIDRATHGVWADGVPVTTLSALELRALISLTERVNQVVTKDELSELIHPEDACPASDWSLSSLIHRIRRALGDREKPPKYIETVRGVGFRIKNAAFTRSFRPIDDNETA